MNTDNITVFIIDDEPAIRDALALMIAQENLNVMTFESAEQFLAEYKTCELGCAIVDIRMAGMDGLQLQETLNKRHVPIPVIFLTGHGDIPMSVKAMKAGAVDFLTKPVTREKLINAVSAAISECEKIQGEIERHQHLQSRLAELTSREKDVMSLAVQGYHNKEIARHLGISHRTVEIHKSKIMHKTGACNLLDLARIAQDCDLISQ